MSSSSTVPSVLWVQLLGSSVEDRANGVAVGSDGSIYVTGETFGGDFAEGQVFLNSNGDGFISKLNANGVPLWTRFVSTNNQESNNGVSVAADGSVYVVGRTSAGTLDGQISNGGWDCYLIKYSSNGDKLWSRLFGSASSDTVNALSIDRDGNVIVAGETSGPFDGQTYNEGKDGFVTKFDAAGNKIWTRFVGSSSYDFISDVAVSQEGSVYLVGSTQGNLDGQVFNGGMDGFLTKLSPNGTKQWTRLIGGASTDEARGAAVGTDGSIFVTGYTHNNLDGQVNNGTGDLFVSKFTSDGIRTWTRLVGSKNGEYGDDVVVSPDGSVLLTGGSDRGGSTVTKFTSSGEFLWSKSYVANLGYKTSGASLSDGTFLLAGMAQGFSPKTSKNGSEDAFVAKLLVTEATTIDSPTYSISANQSSINEGSTATFTVSTTNVASGTSLAYSLSGVSASDITGGSLSGSTTVGTNGEATISIPVAADQTTEGNETLTVTTQGKSASTTIIDTSTTPVVPTYSVSANQSSVNEGSTATFTVSTTNVTSGTSLAYTLSGVSASDVTGGSLSGTTTVGSNGQATISVSIAADQTTEDNETLTVTVQGKTASTTIVDSSLSPSPIFKITPEQSPIKFGNYAVFNIETQYVPPGTVIPYTITPSYRDYVYDGVFSGTVAISETGGAQVRVPVAYLGIVTNSPQYIKLTLEGPDGYSRSSNVDLIPLDNGTRVNLNSSTSGWLHGNTYIINVDTNYTSTPYVKISGSDPKYFGKSTQSDLIFPVALDGSGRGSIAINTTGSYIGATNSDLGYNNVTNSSEFIVSLLSSPSGVPLSSNKWSFLEPVLKGLSVSSTSIAEGDLLTFTLTTQNVSTNVAIPWSVSGGVDSGDFVSGLMSGTIKVGSDGRATIQLPTSQDQKTEGAETFTLVVGSKSSSVTILDTSTTPATPTYSMSANQSSVNEGSTATFTVSTTNVASGTTLAYTLSGGSAADITGGSLSGTTTVGSNGQATISIPIAADQTTEGNETLTVTVQGKTASTTIVDTSTTPTGTYALAASSSSVNEGGTASFVLTTTNVAAGTSLAYTISGVSASDLFSNSLSGSVSVASGGTTVIAIPVLADNLTEGTETMTMSLQGKSASINILDTSTTPTPTYSIAANTGEVSEGSNFIVTLSTTNVPVGTVYPWAITSLNMTGRPSSADFDNGVTEGLVVVDSSGKAIVTLPVKADQLTEGYEDVYFSFYTDTTKTKVLANTTASIKDTSASGPSYTITANQSSINEGSTATFTVSTTNVASGANLSYLVNGSSGFGVADVVGGNLSGSFSIDGAGKGTGTCQPVLSQ